jgi:predicted RNA binding protein YcfA (HicA-like mRNA interferase family)
MKYSELHKKLRKAGCVEYRQGNRHPIWHSPITEQTFSTSRHESQEVKKGTLNTILKQAGLK